jgi:hypothetical protein
MDEWLGSGNSTITNGCFSDALSWQKWRCGLIDGKNRSAKESIGPAEMGFVEVAQRIEPRSIKRVPRTHGQSFRQSDKMVIHQRFSGRVSGDRRYHRPPAHGDRVEMIILSARTWAL